MQSQKNSRSERYRNALQDITEAKLSIREAANKWGVTKSTLHERLQGKVGVDRRPGPPSILTKEEEHRIAVWLLEMADRGFGVSKDDLLDTVKKLVDQDKRATPFTNNRPGDKWYRRFMSRNPQLRLRSTRPLDKKRAKVSSADLDEWFSGYEKFIHEQGLQNRPSQIWNCDESGFDLQGRSGKILGPSTKEKPYQITTGTKEHITVLPCFNACGQWIPPYFLFAGKRVPVTYNPLEGGVHGSAFSMTESGYMDTPSFYMWLANHFIPQLPPARPVVLLVDSHESHIDLDSFELARKNNIHIYALLKNATHLVQPADVGLFGAMKQMWYKNARHHAQSNPNTDINKKNFCSVFKTTWEDVMRPSLLVDAFRKSGVYPLDRAQITDAKVKPSLVYAATMQNTLASSLPPSNAENSTTETQSTSSQSTSSPHPSDRSANTRSAFDALECSLNTPTRARYRRRVEEGYDLPGSPVYKAWKSLYQASPDKENKDPSSQATNVPIQNTPTTIGTLSSISQTPPSSMSNTMIPNETMITMLSSFSRTTPSSSILDDILVYPSAPENTKKSVNKVQIPNFMTSETSMKILLDQKLKKAREMAEKQKRLKEREEKREAKKKETERKKKEREQKKREREQTRREKEQNTKKKRRNVEVNSDDEVYNENICKVCLVGYEPTDDELLPWVMCDKCNMWMHIDCVPCGVDMTPIENDEQFFCHGCM